MKNVKVRAILASDINPCGGQGIEWQVLYYAIHKNSNLPSTPSSIKDAILWIAKFGGFLGQTRDKNYLVVTISRGLQRLRDMVDGWHLFQSLSNFET